MCLTCGCMQAHLEMGEHNIRYEDIEAAAEENGRSVAETLDIMERTKARTDPTIRRSTPSPPDGQARFSGPRCPSAYNPPAFRRSSVVERAAVNRLVVGSNPTAGATCLLESGRLVERWAPSTRRP